MELKNKIVVITGGSKAEIIIENLKKENPEEEQIIKRPNSNPIR